MADDDYFDDVADDAALSAAIEAAERRRAPTAPTAAGAGPSATGSSSTVKSASGIVQPTPQKINRPKGFSSIIVNTRQKGNPILTGIKLPWEYGDVAPDYIIGATTCALFLSLKYHRLHPEYIYGRIKNLGHTFNLRVLLVLVDTEQHPEALKELTKTSLINDLTVILAWSAAEAGKYLELYKSLEHAPPTKIKERAKTDYLEQVQEMVTTVRSVNKTDAVGLITMFGSVRGCINGTESQISEVTGWGEKKVQNWTKAVRTPFRTGAVESVRAERAVPLNATKEFAAVNARMGIGPKKQTGARTGSQAEPMDLDDDDDDDMEAMMAIAEMETEQARKTGQQISSSTAAPSISESSVASSHPKPTVSGSVGDEASDGVMAALAKLRQD